MESRTKEHVARAESDGLIETSLGIRQIDRPYYLYPYGRGRQDFVYQGSVACLDSKR